MSRRTERKRLLSYFLLQVEEKRTQWMLLIKKKYFTRAQMPFLAQHSPVQGFYAIPPLLYQISSKYLPICSVLFQVTQTRCTIFVQPLKLLIVFNDQAPILTHYETIAFKYKMNKSKIIVPHMDNSFLTCLAFQVIKLYSVQTSKRLHALAPTNWLNKSF